MFQPPTDINENRNHVPFSYRRNSAPFPLQYGMMSFSNEAPHSPSFMRRASIDETAMAPFLEPPSENIMNTKRQSINSRRSERSKRRKSIDQDDAYIMEEEEIDEEEEEFVPKTPPKAERGRARKTKKKPKFECAGKDKCDLCKNGTPYYLHKSMNPGWRETLLAVFEYFPKRVNVRQWRQEHNNGDQMEDADSGDPSEDIDWLYLPDAYGFLEYHWDLLCPPQHRNRNCTNWRKTLQDTLSHNRTYFISGKEIFGRTGFWRLYERAPSPSHHITDERSRFLKGEGIPTLFSTPITVDSFFRIPEPQSAVKSSPGSLTASAEMPNKTGDFSELQLLLEAIDCVQRK